MHARNIFKIKILWKRIFKKPWNSWLYFFFSTQSLLMPKAIKNKRSLELVTSRSSDYKTSSEKFIYLSYIIWPSLVTKCKAVFELFQKLHLQIYANQFFTSICTVEFGLWKGRGKIQKIEYLENEKSFFDEIKYIFHSF